MKLKTGNKWKKINETQSLLLGNINKNDKTLARLTKEKEYTREC